ncbi:MAG: inorganic phosphate transporter [bacterium]|nr:inorganic phosphate transporter [bacterium]
MDIYFVAIIILAGLAISDLMVGVSNDAVNFLNSSIGSRVAPRHVIFIISGLGMLAGVTFSRGMMEVARKGIFHPKYFTMPELMVIFLAVMLTDILLLDLYNTFGLPTSTTVSIVFELLGAAVVVSLIKISQSADGMASLVKYINTGKALAIISGILLSVVIAFICGAIIQFLSRLLFTFDFHKRLRRYGAVWGGLALAAITYFILIKGAKGSTFITPETLTWIKGNTGLILLAGFGICAVFLQIMILFTKVNILKPIVLIGTFALAMAFAANDLVNFIGVPLAGLNAYKVAHTTESPLTAVMTELQKATPSDTLLLVLAGIIMAATLWFSRKARTVTKTEINLGRQDEGVERFGSSPLSRTVVRMVTSISETLRKIIPTPLMDKINSRFEELDAEISIKDSIDDEKPSFDLVRASVNLMVASTLISIGTSLKLPLSTTYVTFMVAMGTSFSDRAWGRDSAVYRVTGVLTVIGGWFLTALMAFTVSGIFALIIFYLEVPGVLGLLSLGLFVLVRNRSLHKKREKEEEDSDIFNLKKITDGHFAIATTFEHTGYFLREVAKIVTAAYDGLVNEERITLKKSKKEAKKIRYWGNVIVANVFKTLRLLRKEDSGYTRKYAQSVNALQGIAESQRDVNRRAYDHVSNNHKGLLPVQLEELKEVKDLVVDMLERTASDMMNKNIDDFQTITGEEEKLTELLVQLDKNQVSRIQDESSKTRLSILFYGFTRDTGLIAKHTVNLMKIFSESFKLNGHHR